MSELVRSFTQAFAKAIRLEMEAMRLHLGSFEVSLYSGEQLPAVNEGRRRYSFKLTEKNDKLLAGIECSLRHGEGEALISVTDVTNSGLSLDCPISLPLGSEPFILVIYPWFLYERLTQGLEQLPASSTHFLENALMVFGRREPVQQSFEMLSDHSELNRGQIQAVELCLGNSVAFVWGPPGTGKTTTLGHIVKELLNAGKRVLVTSTTNAAVDQALAKLAGFPDMSDSLRSGSVIRIGRTGEETFGTDVHEVMKRLDEELINSIKEIRICRNKSKSNLERLDPLLEGLKDSVGSSQLSLFDDLPGTQLSMINLTDMYEPSEVNGLLILPVEEQLKTLEGKVLELRETVADCESRIKLLENQLIGSEARAIRQAKLIIATMANMYVNRLLIEERFDVVIVEEAGMAVLPAVFFCSSLASEKVLAIGDPRQLPPIVQSSDPYVFRAMGRSIFDVSISDPDDSDTVALLSIQYRMHPDIGSLVSELYYGGRLNHDITMKDRQSIADRKPGQGHPLVLVDTGDLGKCGTLEGSYSRFNETTAGLSAQLAEEAVGDGITSIAVITPYVEQSRRIRHLLLEKHLRKVECRTIHRFQGNERDVVIIDMVDGEPYAPGILLAGSAAGSSAANLLNVSISRARGKLIVLADLDYFREKASGAPIGKLLEEMERRAHVLRPGRPTRA